MPKQRPGSRRGDQRWSTFLSNHAKAIIACDFFVAVTATFRSLYVFVVIHHATRQLLHVNVTAHPTAAWTLQQMRETVGLSNPDPPGKRSAMIPKSRHHLDENVTVLVRSVLPGLHHEYSLSNP